MKESGEYGPQSGRRRKGKMEMGGCRRVVGGEGDVTMKFLSKREIPNRRTSEGCVVEGINFVIMGKGSPGVRERRYLVIEVNFCPQKFK